MTKVQKLLIEMFILLVGVSVLCLTVFADEDVSNDEAVFTTDVVNEDTTNDSEELGLSENEILKMLPSFGFPKDEFFSALDEISVSDYTKELIENVKNTINLQETAYNLVNELIIKNENGDLNLSLNDVILDVKNALDNAEDNSYYEVNNSVDDPIITYYDTQPLYYFVTLFAWVNSEARQNSYNYIDGAVDLALEIPIKMDLRIIKGFADEAIFTIENTVNDFQDLDNQYQDKLDALDDYPIIKDVVTPKTDAGIEAAKLASGVADTASEVAFKTAFYTIVPTAIVAMVPVIVVVAPLLAMIEVPYVLPNTIRQLNQLLEAVG